MAEMTMLNYVTIIPHDIFSNSTSQQQEISGIDRAVGHMFVYGH